MPRDAKTLTVNLSRVIAGAPAAVFDAWMDPKRPCNPWSSGKTVGLVPRAGSVFCVVKDGAGYVFGRVLQADRGRRLRHTWMSAYTRGLESTVTVTFQRRAGGTLMTLRHGGLPNDDHGRLHREGWRQFLGRMEGRFGKGR
jgi:uncharacterized protein YndB with AHSA1/START domain